MEDVHRRGQARARRSHVRRLGGGRATSLDAHPPPIERAPGRRGRRLLDRLSPAIGELIPARTSPLGHGEGCRWMTYWEGRSGWALVAVVREPGSTTPIHAHPHRLLGKAIEGTLEELRFREADGKI